MKLAPKKARLIIDHDDPNWKSVTDATIVDQRRWSTAYEQVFLYTPSNKYYLFGWSQGSTECQDEQPFEYDTIVEPQEVVEKEVLIKKWVPICN
jgi:hypothetical protein